MFYMGDRLLSAVIPYEESGLYDERMWVKPPESSDYWAHTSKEELLRLPLDVKADDGLAAEAADGRPVHCRRTILQVGGPA
ncbi:hypothetical protein L1987_71591 [Smallanthus sonchifolius]|uniref:Uncharacterized protein n=1 Tax=Smallanthus sonchifolius TaxID=185202 RepID=A0ACB9AU80_9ASTR|nr:hypothetical protein L1987_71591 [Smallanthus sonchifolius]